MSNIKDKTTSASSKTDTPFDFQELVQRWQSPLVSRNQDALDRFSGGLLNARTLANLDSLGRGPEGKIKVGRRVAYSTESLVAWMKAKSNDSQGG